MKTFHRKDTLSSSIIFYRKQAIKELKAVRKKAREFFKERKSLSLEKPPWGIGANTFRSYTGFQLSPSSVYREWASNTLSASKLREISTICDCPSFVKCHKGLQKSLAQYWEKKQGRKLSFAQMTKVIDLFVKFLCRIEIRGFPGVNDILIEYGHIPLDRFSLLAVRRCFHGIVISPTPSMGNIDGPETYNFIQGQIGTLMQAAKLPNLYFDFYAWDLAHGGQAV